MKVAILGTGAYGIALASIINMNGHDITMWTKFEEEKNELERTKMNIKVLPGYVIPDNIKFTNDMKRAIYEAELIIIAVPAAFVDSVTSELKEYVVKKQHICIATKGIERVTCLFPKDVIRKHIKTGRVAVISGPSFAIDIVKQVPIGLSIATVNKHTESCVKSALSNKYLKLRTTRDILGVELCGAIKNVIAIAAGILDGMGMPESTQAMFITESVNDIKNLIKALGGNKKTVLTFAGFGDLLLTSTSKKSRNFTFGHMIGEKKSKQEIEFYISNTTIEGLYTLESIYNLLNHKKVKMPIIDLVYDIIFNDLETDVLIDFLNSKD